MKIWHLLIVIVFGYFTYILGTVHECKAKGMKPSRKFDLTLKSWFFLFTFKKLYVCDECKKVHRRTKDDLDICEGRFKHKVFVSQHCHRGYPTCGRSIKHSFLS